MRKILAVALFASLAAPTLYASCPSYYGGYTGYGYWGNSSFGSYFPGYGFVSSRYLRTAKCVIREVHDDGTLRVWDEGDGQEHLVHLRDQTLLKARYKRDFDGRRNLEPGDLQVGQRIAVTALKKSGTVLKVQVLRHDGPKLAGTTGEKLSGKKGTALTFR